MKRMQSIRGRLLTGLVVSLTFVLAAGCAALYWSQRQMLCMDFDRQLAEHSFAAFRQLRPGPFAGLAESNAPDEPPVGLRFVALIDAASGEVLKSVPLDAIDGHEVGPLPAKPDKGELSTIRTKAGDEIRILMRRMELPPRRGTDGETDAGPAREHRGGPPFVDPGLRGGPSVFPQEEFGPFRDMRPPNFDRWQVRPLVMVAGADLAPVHAALRRWLLLLLIGGLAGEVLVIAAVVLAVRRGLRPLRKLEGDIAAIDGSGLGRRVPEEGLPRELSPMARQLNDLLWRLQDAFSRERAFTSSAAHEFRTPLAGIRTQIEVCLLRERGGDEYRGTLRQCLESTVSLQRLVDALLDLARLDAGLTKPAGQEVDVAELVRSRWSQCESLAAGRRCRAEIAAPPSLLFETDPVLLGNVLANLLGNAAEYADAGGTVRVKAFASAGRLRLTVTNPASSLAAADVPKLFDRFWRKDASRTDTGQHCGLGLAIAKRCVEVLGGQIAARLDSGLLEFAMELPSLFRRDLAAG